MDIKSLTEGFHHIVNNEIYYLTIVPPSDDAVFLHRYQSIKSNVSLIAFAYLSAAFNIPRDEIHLHVTVNLVKDNNSATYDLQLVPLTDVGIDIIKKVMTASNELLKESKNNNKSDEEKSKEVTKFQFLMTINEEDENA